jgi:2-hydroxy fatty acid dioxygenase
MEPTTPTLSTSSFISSASRSSCGTVCAYNSELHGISSTLNRSFQVLAYDLPKPTFVPQVHYHLNDYLKFEVTYGTLQGLLWLAYYYMLEPFAAVSATQICDHRRFHPRFPQLLYTPQAILSILTANAFAQRPDHMNIALMVNVACWIAQFIGHGFAEGRSPALLDNLVGGTDFSC